MDINKLLNEGKYEEAIILIKQALQEDGNNSDLWYHLFLAENGDYFTTDFSSGYSDELSFNKALENASRRKSAEYMSEYNFYKSISKCNGLNKLFRYAQYGNVISFRDYFISNIDNIKINIDNKDIEDFYDNLDYITYNSQGDNELDLCTLLVNLIYIELNNESMKKILDELIIRIEKSNTSLYPYDIATSKLEIKNLLVKLCNKLENPDEFSFDKDRVLKRIYVCLENKDFSKAKELIEELLTIEPNSAEYNLLYVMAHNNISNEKELNNCDIKLHDDYHMKIARDNASNELKSRIIKYMDNSKKKYVKKVKIEDLLNKIKNFFSDIWDKILNIFEVFCYYSLYFWPLVLGVFTIIIFIIFDDELLIICSRGWAIFGLIIYMIFAIIFTIFKLKDEIDEKIHIISFIVMLVLTVFSLIMFDGLFSFELNEYIQVEYQKIILENGATKLYYEVTNNTKKDLTSYHQEICFYDGDELIHSGNWYWPETLESKDDITLISTVNLSDVDITTLDIDNLGITFSVEQIGIRNPNIYKEYVIYFKDDFTVIKSNDYLDSIYKK